MVERVVFRLLEFYHFDGDRQRPPDFPPPKIVVSLGFTPCLLLSIPSLLTVEAMTDVEVKTSHGYHIIMVEGRK